jgi:outer membrane protein OmpA-like peptidoglycan-associated protein
MNAGDASFAEQMPSIDLVEVAGFADITGKADWNQTLSEARANAVTRYLEQQGNVPMRRILTPAGMGTLHEAALNDRPEGRKMNRRGEVKVPVNQGVAARAATVMRNGM